MPTGVYIRTKPVWNKGLKGAQISWAKGLTVKDPRIAKFVEAGHKSMQGKPTWISLNAKKGQRLNTGRTLWKKGQSPWNKGIKTGLVPSVRFVDNDPRITRENHWNWKNGISKVNKTERELAWYSGKYRRWRKAIFTRDNYTCQDCGQIGGYLHADHIKPWALYPELRYRTNNGQTLCVKSHQKKTQQDKLIYA